MQASELKSAFHQYYLLMRLDKPIGIFLLLWPTLWALWMAGEGRPDTLVVVVFVIGVILMRSAGCIINDFADRKIDNQVERTRNRPLTTGAVSVQEALLLFGAIVLVAFILVLQLNLLTIQLAFVAVALTIVYPFMKRYTYFPQLVLGAAFAWSIPMAYAALTEKVPMDAWVLFLATLLWTMVYDTIYAMVDREDDIRIGVKSTAILFGEMDIMIIAMLQVMVMFALVLVGNKLQFDWPYYLGLGVAAVLIGYQQFLIKDRVREKCFKAFLNNNWVGAAVFAGVLMHFLIQEAPV